MKVTIVLSSPVGGTIVEVNAALTLKPEIVNEDPYERDGWQRLRLRTGKPIVRTCSTRRRTWP